MGIPACLAGQSQNFSGGDVSNFFGGSGPRGSSIFLGAGGSPIFGGRGVGGGGWGRVVGCVVVFFNFFGGWVSNFSGGWVSNIFWGLQFFRGPGIRSTFSWYASYWNAFFLTFALREWVHSMCRTKQREPF